MGYREFTFCQGTIDSYFVEHQIPIFLKSETKFKTIGGRGVVFVCLFISVCQVKLDCIEYCLARVRVLQDQVQNLRTGKKLNPPLPPTLFQIYYRQFVKQTTIRRIQQQGYDSYNLCFQEVRYRLEPATSHCKRINCSIATIKFT